MLPSSTKKAPLVVGPPGPALVGGSTPGPAGTVEEGVPVPPIEGPAPSI